MMGLVTASLRLLTRHLKEGEGLGITRVGKGGGGREKGCVWEVLMQSANSLAPAIMHRRETDEDYLLRNCFHLPSPSLQLWWQWQGGAGRDGARGTGRGTGGWKERKSPGCGLEQGWGWTEIRMRRECNWREDEGRRGLRKWEGLETGNGAGTRDEDLVREVNRSPRKVKERVKWQG